MSKENTSKKLVRSKSGFRIIAVDDNFKSPFLLPEPKWIPDKEASSCKSCVVNFGFTTRRHHCRRCGQVYCATCCRHKLELPRLSFIDPVRVCDDCVPITIHENKFFDQHIKTLTNGATMILEESSLILPKSEVICKLSPDHRQLVFDGVKLAPLEMSSIKILRVNEDFTFASLEEDDELGVQSVEIEFTDVMSGENQLVKLAMVPDTESRKAATSWIAAMQEAVKLLEEYALKG